MKQQRGRWTWKQYWPWDAIERSAIFHHFCGESAVRFVGILHDTFLPHLVDESFLDSELHHAIQLSIASLKIQYSTTELSSLLLKRIHWLLRVRTFMRCLMNGCGPCESVVSMCHWHLRQFSLSTTVKWVDFGCVNNCYAESKYKYEIFLRNAPRRLCMCKNCVNLFAGDKTNRKIEACSNSLCLNAKRRHSQCLHTRRWHIFVRVSAPRNPSS